MVLKYVADAAKAAWSVDDLRTLALMLARLHRRKYEGHGKVGKLTQDEFSFLYRFDVAVDYWCNRRTQMGNDADGRQFFAVERIESNLRKRFF